MKVKIDKLVKKYDEALVLDIDGFTFNKGLIYGIVGANGAGKSTLLRLIAGLDNDYEGKILYSSDEEKGFESFKGIKSKIVMQHQKPYLFDSTVKENIEISFKFNGRYDEALCDKLIDILDLKEIQNKKSNKISGGEFQRTALARTLATNAELILLDEPTSSVDPENSRIIEDVILNMIDINRTIILITHNIFQAKRLCDKIIYMEKGKIVDVVDSKDVESHKLINELIQYTM